jgi:transcriptional regulator with XRE-family HTH domain
MSESKGRKPVVDIAPVVPPPISSRSEPNPRPPVLSAPMTPQQLKQAESLSTGRPVHGVGLIRAQERSIPTPKQWAEIRARVTGGESHGAASPTLVRLGRALRAEREHQGLSLSEVSDRCGIEKGAVSRLENGVNANPTLETLRRYAQALGKDVAISLTDAANTSEPAQPAESKAAPERLGSSNASADPRNWETLFAQWLFYSIVKERKANLSGEERPSDLGIPPHLQSDFDQFFTSYATWAARIVPEINTLCPEDLRSSLTAER